MTYNTLVNGINGFVESHLANKETRAKHADEIRKKLKLLSGLDFSVISRDCTMIGTEEPILYEFSNLILNKSNNINNIIEFGCGMSTIWFTYLSTLKNINFVSFEHEKKWKNECIKLIKDKINIDNPNIQLININLPRLPIPFEKADLIFVDGLNRITTLYNNTDIISNNTIIIADDMTGDLSNNIKPESTLDSSLMELGKAIGYKEMNYFWSRDRIIAILDKKNRFNKDEQLYWNVEL